MGVDNIFVIKKNGEKHEWDSEKIRKACMSAATRVNRKLTEEELDKIVEMVKNFALSGVSKEIPISIIHNAVEGALNRIAPDVAASYMSYRDWKIYMAKMMDRVWSEKCALDFADQEKENANKDGARVSTKRSLITSFLNKEFYEMFFLTAAEKTSIKEGYYYVHDEDARLDGMNCCLFDIGRVLKGGFDMENIWYTEPKRISTAFDVIGDVVISAASQQYGGFTLPEVDKVLAVYAEKTYQEYLLKGKRYEVKNPELYAEEMTLEDIRQGYQGWEIKFNTVASSRGDYPFVTITFGLSTSRWGREISKAILNVHAGGQGAEGHKKAVLFPKLVFLYDENLHGPGKELEDVFEAGIDCSSKTMYPDWLSLTGEGYVAEIYKKYGLVISPMGCRAFLSPWFERGGMYPADEDDKPVFVGRFNMGAVSLNLPMILARARELKRDFYDLLDEYLEEIRGLIKRTYEYFGKIKAKSNPLSFCQGGFYGGTLGMDDCVAPLLKSATASFGITALHELQMLFNGKSIREDGAFALSVVKHIKRRIEEFKEEDSILYAIYGTPAESLCYKQVDKFRAKYGIIEGVSDREYVSNSFHCHVSEDMSPIEKQDKEYRFWDYFNGGKIQYVKYPINYNREAIKSLIRRAMKMGFYEGVNLSLAYCDDCGHEELDMDECCPVCGSKNLTKIDRMNGYLAYSRVKGTTRLNRGKMAEIEDRVSM